MTTLTDSTRIKHLVFDMGGVLVQIAWHQKVSALLGRDIAFNEIHALWGASPAVTAFENGAISFADFTDRFIAEHQLTISPERFQQEFLAIVQDDMPGICTLLNELQSRFTLSLLSNTNEAHLTLLQQRNTFLRYIENPFTSLAFGVMKPSPLIYQKMLAALGCEPDEVLFFDDGVANVKAARALGIHAEQVFGTEDIRQVLNSYGLN